MPKVRDFAQNPKAAVGQNTAAWINAITKE